MLNQHLRGVRVSQKDALCVILSMEKVMHTTNQIVDSKIGSAIVVTLKAFRICSESNSGFSCLL